jgi:SPP1 family predicted phage head-tail adaptor
MIRGRLRHSALLQTATSAEDDYGEEGGTWSTGVTVRCNIEPLQGKELEAARAIHSELTHKITMNYRAGMTHKQRIVHRSVNYDLQHQIDKGLRHRNLIWYAKTGTSNG